MCNSNGYIVWRYATSKLFCDVLFNFCILSSRIDMPLYMYYFAKLLHTHALRFKLLLVFLYLALYILLKLINNSTRKSRKFKRKVSANRRKITNLISILSENIDEFEKHVQLNTRKCSSSDF